MTNSVNIFELIGGLSGWRKGVARRECEAWENSGDHGYVGEMKGNETEGLAEERVKERIVQDNDVKEQKINTM